MTQSPQQTLNYCKIILCAIHKVRRRKHSEYDSKSIRSSAQYVTLDVKLDQEKSKHGALVQKNGFGPKFLHRMHAESGKMAQQSLTPLLLLLIGWIV